MKKKILLILIVVFLIISLAFVYLNKVVLPEKLKLFVTQRLQEQTNKTVELESLQLNIFKGLVLRGLEIYDDKQTFLKLKEADCGFLIFPFFKKRIVIPSVTLRNLTLFLERKDDKALNIMQLFMPGQDAKAKTQESKFNIFIYKIAVVDSRIEFKDKSIIPEFTKIIDNLDLTLRLSVPADIKFNLRADILSGSEKTKLAALGIYKVIEKEIQAKVSCNNLLPKEFSAYYPYSRISAGDGYIDIFTNLIIKEGKIKFSGTVDIKKLDILGIEIIENVDDIQGRVNFDNEGIMANKLTADILQIPVEISLKISGFKEPVLEADITAQKIGLNNLNNIIKDKFKFVIPGEFSGEAGLSLKIESDLPLTGPLPISGYLDIFAARLNLENLNFPLENISGRVIFSPDLVKWPDLSFRYGTTDYKMQGSLIDFQAPQVAVAFSSKELYLDCEFGIKDKTLRFTKFNGRYRNSDFSLNGMIDITDSFSWPSDLSAKGKIDLKDLSSIFAQFKDSLDKLKPSGIVNADIRLAGDIKDIKSCAIQADLTSSSLSIYGLKGNDFSAQYLQKNNLVDIPLLRLALYDGILEGSLSMNLSAEHFPYIIEGALSGVKLEKLKLDTAIKDKDIAGVIEAKAKVNATIENLSRLSGTGSIAITEGKIWELDLLKGLGKLIFSKDFTNIIFEKGNCSFVIQDKTIYTDSINMQSEFVSLDGPVKIGFDGSLDAALGVHIDEDKSPLTGTFKDITTAIIGQAEKFGTIHITGTVKEPQYKFKTSAVDIIKSLKDRFLGQ
ncbi:MAG: hypothetical protein A2166_05300 [Omnitrophica WOR_2 bacterium RBG_13_41_10]|nr:MAG: hypothetical protein A2166_05300 [Omnitrophica WOR_2 bacterium RBG_13_41_10]